jgi:predicted dienelactone hydrolase
MQLPSRALTAVFLVAITGLLAACGDSESLREPDAAGPYGIGITERTFTRTSSTTEEPRELQTVIWYPTSADESSMPVQDAEPAADDGPYPIVLFSHGASGSPGHASYLTEHLASWGYVVVAPPHPGNTIDDGPCPTECLAESYINRLPDMIFTLDEVLGLDDDPSDPLAEIIDPELAVMTGFRSAV